MMNLSDLGKTVAKYAPLLGAVLPLPGGAAIGAIIAEVFGGDVNKPEELISLIQNDPQAVLKLKEIQSNQDIEITRIITADKQNARQREIDYIKATGKDDRTLKNLAYFTTIGFFGTLFLLFFPQVDLNEAEKQLLALLIGMLASKWQTVMDYFFGSSNKV
jgi:hypothetical protein